MLASAARSFSSIPSRKSARPGTSSGPPASRRPNTATMRPTTADGPSSVARPSTASPVSVLRRDSAASSTATATSETAIDTKLPKELSFLTTACIELWIDQEGFRAVRPAFWLASSREPGELAEFRMRPKQAYIFHHAAFDSAPVLRRLTVNGDESRDYISRQASLSVKKNGVYTVSGVEDRGRLAWRFEYLVTDRQDLGGRAMSGEKVRHRPCIFVLSFSPPFFLQSFTPLSFACAPQLLIPANGKKVHLFHVMRKSVTPKLAAAKVDPSTSPSSSTAGHSSSTIGVPILPPDLTNVPLLDDIGPEGLGGRRRAASHSLGRTTSRPWGSSTRPSTGGTVHA
ncbi:hypothetical protein EXIGLDRAFT_144639 [Exidia glandulosa HHB12029]|uniref:Uncharacterized protein n=1 Tax=Exidia glandulosa HHB12029 TaxID=1314781 RepID=A0A165NCH3_EXIGL|nr:hypothetical protein EXIGLDRAFT_144639 [Exidia glandulosa HHB12029]